MKIPHGRKEDGRLGAGTTSSNLRAAPEGYGGGSFSAFRSFGAPSRSGLAGANLAATTLPGIEARALRRNSYSVGAP